MKKILKAASVFVGTFIFSSLAFAEGGDSSGVMATAGLVALGSGLCMGIAAFGAATGQGKAVSSAVEGIARNPNAKDQVFIPLILGLVFMEFQALMGFIIAIFWYMK